MKRFYWVASVFVLIMFSFQSFSQKIDVSDAERANFNKNNFEIIGKANGKCFVYDNLKLKNTLSIYDAEMKPIDNITLYFIPENAANTNFILYPDKIDVFYQYTKRGIMYCMAAQLDLNGKLINTPVEIDTALSSSNSDIIYSLITSENKEKLMVIKVNKRNPKFNLVTSLLFDKNLTLIHKTVSSIAVAKGKEFLSGFELDNDGDLVCYYATGQTDNINKLTMLTKAALEDNYVFTEIPVNGIYLDDIKVKTDNINNHYLIAAFYSNKKRGNIDGLYAFVWDKKNKQQILSTASLFNGTLRQEASAGSNLKTAFDNYFFRQIIMKIDGGFIAIAETEYSTTQDNYFNRWDNFAPYVGFGAFGGFYSTMGRPINAKTYYADNIGVFSFDMNGKLIWSNFVRKSERQENSNTFLSYGVMNTGDKINFLYNVSEKGSLSIYGESITPDGQLIKIPTSSSNSHYQLMLRYGKQIGQKQMIIPCMYGNFVCFAKLEL